MPFYQNHSETTVKKALHWLNEQDNDWSKHIKDSNIAVKMYLKSQKKERESSSQKEIQNSFLKETGAVLKNFSAQKSPPANFSPAENFDSLKNLRKSKLDKEDSNLSEQTKPSEEVLHLDEKSRQALKQTKKELNLESEKEVLRLLIQLGRKSLNKL